MKKRPVSLVFGLGVCIVLVCITSGALQAGELSYSVNLAFSEVSIQTQKGYTMLSFDGAYYENEPGYPLLPYMVKRYLLPRGMRVTNVALHVDDVGVIPLSSPVYPAQPPRPIGRQVSGFVDPLQEVYSADDPVSDFGASLVGEGLLEGEKIVSVAINPLRYIPSVGKLEIAERMVLTIEYEPDPDYSSPWGLSASQEQSAWARTEKLIENPELLTAPPMSFTLADNTYRHAIVTPNALRATFVQLASWNTARGVKDTVLILESIATQYPGRDLAEKIRNFVIYAHDEWGLEYLLLGGDDVLVPTRDCYVSSVAHGPKDTIPTDMYFGCLDGDWNSDGDATWGEMGDDVDLFAEVVVGRACVNDIDEATLFINKVKTYQDTPASGYAYKLLLPSEILWTDPYYPGDSTNNDIAAMAPSGTQISKLYETQGTLSRQAVEDSLNSGMGLAHHCAHGNETALSCADYAFYNWQAEALVNGDKLTVYASIACNVGAFDYEGFGGCLVEGFQRAKQGGTVAWVGNSRYGWGTPPYRGPSEDIDVSFFEKVYDPGNSEIGPSLADAKEDNLGWSGSYYGRWCIYELNLHGDPAMSVHYRDPSEFEVSYDEPYEGQEIFTVTVSSQASYPVDNMLVCVQQSSSDTYSWAYTDASGIATLIVSFTSGSADLSVTGSNHSTCYENNIQIGTRKAQISLAPDTSWLDVEVDGLSSSFTVSNVGTDTLRISSIMPYQTSWIDSVFPTDCNIMEEVSRNIEFFADTTGLEDGIYLGKLSISSNDPDRPVVYHPIKLIKGDWPDIEVSPDTLVFDVAAGDPLTLSCDVSNQGRADLEVSSILTTTYWVTNITPASLSIPVGAGSASVSITVDTTGLGFGTYQGSVLFATNDPDEEEYVLPVTLNMGAPDIVLSPDTLQFFFSWEEDAVNKLEDDLNVANEGDRILEVSNIIPGKKWITVSEPTSFDLDPDDSRDVHVTVYAEHMKQGVYDAYITLRSNDPDEPDVREPVRLLVEETPPSISCSPDTAVMDKETMRGSFWVCNLGMRDLIVSEVSTETPWIYGVYPPSFILRGRDSAQVSMIGDASKINEGPTMGMVLLKTNDVKNLEYEEPVKLGSSSGVADADLPKVFELSQVTPNPVSSDCLIRFAVPYEAVVSVFMYDVTGKKVRTFAEGRTQPGYHMTPWMGIDDAGRRLPQGVYLLRMQSPEYTSVQKIVLMR